MHKLESNVNLKIILDRVLTGLSLAVLGGAGAVWYFREHLQAVEFWFVFDALLGLALVWMGYKFYRQDKELRRALTTLLRIGGKVTAEVAWSSQFPKIFLSGDFSSFQKQFGNFLNSLSEGVTIVDSSWNMVYANTTAINTLHFTAPEGNNTVPAKHLWEKMKIFSEDGRELGMDELPARMVITTGAEVKKIIRVIFKDSKDEKWLSVTASPLIDEQGNLIYVVNLFIDITADRISTESLKAVEGRQKFLVKAGEILSSSLDYKTTLKQITKLAVPQLGDWAAVDMLAGPDNLERLAVEHQDPKKVIWAYELQKRFPYKPDDPSGLSKVLRTGKPEFYPSIAREDIEQTVQDPEEKEIIHKIGFSSIIIVPIILTDKAVGAITFVYAESGRHYKYEDLELAEELARRAAVAIQNAKLYELSQATAERQREHAMLLDTLLSKAPIGFAFFDTEIRYMRVNEIMADINGISAENHVGKKVTELLPSVGPTIEKMARQVLDSRLPVLDQEVSGETPANPGIVRHWLESYYPVFGPDNKIQGVGVIVYEVTQRREVEKQIQFQALHDVLTGLPNRKFFQERLDTLLPEAKKLGVMFIDLDRLKDINDTLGHEIGDEVLQEVSYRLKEAAGENNFIARWGGDEFVALSENAATNYDIQKSAQNLINSVQPLMRINGHNLHVTASVGVAIYPQDGQDAASLQRNADTALYRAKEMGKNRFELYNSAMNIKAEERLNLENDLRQALAKKELELYYQPVLDLKTKTINRVEALLRWQHPQLGMLAPGAFLNIAEEIGIINSLGTWVFKTAALNIKELEANGFTLNFNVNVSARQFMEPEMAMEILNILKETGLPPSALDVEITESLAMENLDRTQSLLEHLEKEGVGVTVDDFGTGYSSLYYLKRFPISTLKIDKTFVRHCITDEQDTSIIKAIISMAKSLHLGVVAEGVDTEMQMGLLESLGCDAVQGYHISRPLSLNELLEFLKARQSAKLPEHVDITKQNIS